MESIKSFKPKKGRDKLVIIATVLDIAKDGAPKTQIMYRASLSFSQLKAYLKFMLGNELLRIVFKGGDKELFESTEKGMDFLQRYREITNLMDGGSWTQQVCGIHQNRLPKFRSELGELRRMVEVLETDLSSAVNCPNCEETIFSDYRFCPYCGTELRLRLQAAKRTSE